MGIASQCSFAVLLLMNGLSRLSTLSVRMRVQLRRTCYQHVTGVVSVCHAFLGLVGDISLAGYSMNPLQPGYGYTGPTGATAVNVSNICKCNTVTYSLLSACDACQGIYWFRFDFHAHFLKPFHLSAISWYYFSTNCTQTMPPST